MAFEPPEHLLKSALEKVVFFECRIEQLERDLDSGRGESERLRLELSASTARELALKQELAEVQSRHMGTRRELDESRVRGDQLRSERDRWLSSMLDGQRIRQAGEFGEGEMDLAQFIAELRAEVESLRAGRPLERQHVVEPPPRDVAEAGSRMQAKGKLGFTDEDRRSLLRSARFETRAEETVFAYSLRELGSPFPDSRKRAADRLRALSSREASAALAAALNVETHAEVKPALIDALAASGGIEALSLLSPHLRDEDATVRLASLEACVRLGGERAAPEVERAIVDGSMRIRRRAALLASELGIHGQATLQRALGDGEAAVRRVAVLALAVHGGEVARKALLTAADDVDREVRRAGWEGLGRLFNEPLLSLADEPTVRRRRELRRLEVQPIPPASARLKAQAQARMEAAALAAEPVAPKASRIAEPAPVVAPVAPAPAPVAAAAPPVAPSSPVDQPLPSPALAEQLMAEVATSLRGRTLDELALLGPTHSVERVAAQLLGAGRLVRRNQRYFLA